MFHETFLQALHRFTADATVKSALWKDIAQRYAEQHRHYHNLQHPETLIRELENVRSHIHHWDTMVLAVAYHDVIYDVRQQDNEARSAAHAVQQLRAIVPAQVLQLCIDLILATKSHMWNSKCDINYFTDADLSILGAVPEVYRQYCRDIRSEYSIYPDAVYIPARKKVLHHFLEMKQIFKTAEFYERYEQVARANLTGELNYMSI